MSNTDIDFTLAKAVNGAFKTALQELYKVALISNESDELLYETFDHAEFTEAKRKFLCIEKLSTEDEYAKFAETLRSLPDVSWDIVERIDDGNIKNFCKGFRRLHKLLEQKLSSRSRTWFEMRQKERQFLEFHTRCLEEIKELKEELEVKKARKKKMMSEHVIEDRIPERTMFVAEDFRSMLPSYLKANAEEKIEFVEQFSEIKLSHLQKRQEESEKKLKEASLKCNSALWEVIEETMQTKAFMEWLKNKNESKLEDYDEERETLFTSFKKEMDDCRELCKKYKEVDNAYERVLSERREKEIQKKRNAAATVIQAHFRGFLERRRIKKSGETHPVVQPAAEPPTEEQPTNYQPTEDLPTN